jgi:release factor glutamine methyltransferase
MTIGQALVFGRLALTNSQSPTLDARLLLQHVLQVSHAYLVAHADQALSGDQEEDYGSLVRNAASGMPVPYLIGHAPFYGLDYSVSPAVLIPRPETELLVEEALAWAKGREPLLVVDVGTGSGCIAITLARYLPEARIQAIDVSASALQIARTNVNRHGVQERVTLLQGSLLEPLDGEPDLVVANLPYVADHEWTMVDDSVKWYEPDMALRGGPEGLVVIRALLAQAVIRLASAGAIFLEVGWQQGPAVSDLAQSLFPRARIEVQTDYMGHDRIVAIRTD